MRDSRLGALVPAYRRARVTDLPSLLDYLRVSAHAFGPSTKGDELERLLTALLSEGAVEPLLLVNQGGPQDDGTRQILAAAITGFLRPSLADRWLLTPPAALVDSVFEAESRHERALLRQDEVAARNASGDGLDLVFLAYAAPLGDASEPAISKLIALSHDMFRFFHAGYHCRRAFHPATNIRGASPSLESLGFRRVRVGSDVLVNDLQALDGAPFHPFIVLRRTSPPLLGLSAAEQNMLLHALLGVRDAEMAEDFAVSEETIRKRWQHVFDRVSKSSLGALIWPEAEKEVAGAGRGPEKRRRLLRYVETHLEELRPHRLTPPRLPK